MRNKECAAEEGCKKVENDCYKTAVPTYAHVYAGVDNGYFNLVIAFLFIHISVLLNMTIPLMQAKIDDDGDYDDILNPLLGTPPKVQTGVVVVNGRTQRGQININSHFEHFGAPQTDAQKAASKKQSERDKAANASKKGNKGVPLPQEVVSTTKPTVTGESSDDETDIENATCVADWIAKHVTKNVWVRLALLFVLSTLCITFSGLAITSATNKAQSNQTCNLTSCLTQTFTGILMFVVSIANLALSIYLLIMKFYVRTQNKSAEKAMTNTNGTVGEFKKEMFYKEMHITLAHVLEDISVAAAFMLLVSTFSAQGGTHDDTTLYMDIALIAFIAFMLRLQHDIMVCREDVISCCDDSENMYTDSTGKTHTLHSQVMSYFLNTRLFIFAVIIGSSFVFIERLQATTGVLDAHSTWNQSMRLMVLFTSILPNLCSDVSYEAVHAFKMRKSGTHTAYVGPQIWRRTIYLGYVLVLVASSWGTDGDVVMAMTTSS
jgi:hypothetical protein